MLKIVASEECKLLAQHFLRSQFLKNLISEKQKKMDVSSFQLQQTRCIDNNKENQSL